MAWIPSCTYLSLQRAMGRVDVLRRHSFAATIAVAAATAAGGVLLWWEVNRRVAVEETIRLQHEPCGLTRHHREVFGSGHVNHAKRMPQDDVLVLYLA
eukprot:scaffold173039_cov39-Prasinocladus_malaysianus.AAC.1